MSPEKWYRLAEYNRRASDEQRYVRLLGRAKLREQKNGINNHFGYSAWTVGRAVFWKKENMPIDWLPRPRAQGAEGGAQLDSCA